MTFQTVISDIRQSLSNVFMKVGTLASILWKTASETQAIFILWEQTKKKTYDRGFFFRLFPYYFSFSALSVKKTASETTFKPSEDTETPKSKTHYIFFLHDQVTNNSTNNIGTATHERTMPAQCIVLYLSARINASVQPSMLSELLTWAAESLLPQSN